MDLMLFLIKFGTMYKRMYEIVMQHWSGQYVLAHSVDLNIQFSLLSSQLDIKLWMELHQ